MKPVQAKQKGMSMIYQPALEVPAEIAVKIATGEYVLWGSVVRDTAGRIVKHLGPVELQRSAEEALSVGKRAVRFARAHPALVAIGTAAIAIGGIYVYTKNSTKSTEDAV